jgi:single-stranded-DNA-specific exonuclease
MYGETKVQEIVRQILAKRGITEKTELEAFLNPSYDAHLHDPFLLSDMGPAVERIMEAVKKSQDIVIYGDYDIDGITASAVMIEAITAMGGHATSYIPDRFEEGYGINLAALKLLKVQKVDLVISVDCGITSVKEAAWAIENGLDLIITDHHAVPEVIPEAIAVINPKRPGDGYPFKDLAGVGVAFKVVQALQHKWLEAGYSGGLGRGQEKWLLDLVALGTVCDVVTLVGENRVLARYGLAVLNKTRREGLKALAEVSGVMVGSITSYHLGFVFGPRMNAAGRLEHAAKSLELLMTVHAGEARQIAANLDRLNRQRQDDQAKILEAAMEQAGMYIEDPVLVLAGKDWSHGIVGIVASKLVERWRKPTLVMQIMGKNTKGSARSLGSFNLVEALRAVGHNFSKFGGHHYAAGYTLPTSNLEALRQDINAYAKSIGLIGPLERQVGFDVGLGDLGVIDWDLYEGLQRLAPFGAANPKPRFAVEGLRLMEMRWVGQKKNHLQVKMSDGMKNQFQAIGFDFLEKHGELKEGSVVRAVFQVDKNEFNGSASLQLLIQDMVEQK